MILFKQYKVYFVIGVVCAVLGVVGLQQLRISNLTADVAERDAQISKMETDYIQSVLDYTLKLNDIELAGIQLMNEKENELQQLKANHEKTLNSVNADYNKRMLDMQKRIQKYSALTESSSPELRNLASHTARLDRTLEEGRQVVAELRAGIELRDGQLKALGTLIEKERAIYMQ